MPTSRPRHSITETDAVAQALRDAARRWPDDAGSRSRLLLRLVAAGHRVIAQQRDDDLDRRLKDIESAKGALTGVFEPGYLEDVRRDWPA